jgi:hypothetical protein
MPATIMALSPSPRSVITHKKKSRNNFKPFLLPPLKEKEKLVFSIPSFTSPSSVLPPPSSPSISPTNDLEDDYDDKYDYEEEEEEEEEEEDSYDYYPNSRFLQPLGGGGGGRKTQQKKQKKKTREEVEEATTYTVRSFRNNPFSLLNRKTSSSPLPSLTSPSFSYTLDYDVALRLLKSDLGNWRIDSRQFPTIIGNEVTKAIVISVIELLIGTYQQHFSPSSYSSPSPLSSASFEERLPTVSIPSYLPSLLSHFSSVLTSLSCF